MKRSSTGIVAPMLGNKIFFFATSRLPVPNKHKPKPCAQRRAFHALAPVPFAPLVDAHLFQPPPPYSACLRVPHNTPEEPARATAAHGRASTGTHARPVGLGLEGVENGDGGRFDGLGRLSGGFRASGDGGMSDALRAEVHRVLSERSRRRRTRASERPATCDDVFYASVGVGAALPTRTVSIRTASPTLGGQGWESVRRATISSELKRAASLARRASLRGTRAWRV